MPKAHNPRRGSMQFWPRKRAKHSLARVCSWAKGSKPLPLGFIGYKAGMTYLLATDNRSKSLTKGEKISIPATIIDCPPMFAVGVSFYKNSISGLKKLTSFFSQKLPKELGKKVQLPKKTVKKFDDVKDFDDLRLLILPQPHLASIGTKKPKIIEIALGGSKEDKLVYIKEILGKEISVKDIFEDHVFVDIHGITKGKGFQGTVKRYGVPIKQHKGEKVKRGIGNLGAWTPKRVDFRVPQPGKMGYHLRTEYNKQILKISEDGKEVTPKGGFNNYGIVKNHYLLIKGSVVGARKRAVVLTQAMRSNPKRNKDTYEISFISTK